MSAEQWAALSEELKNHPDREAEMARVADFMAWQLDLRTFRDLRGRGDATQAGAVARSLLQTLPERVARNEIGAAAAEQLQDGLLDAAEPDARTREARRGAERERLQAARPALSAEQQAQAARDASFLQGQEAAIAAWQAGSAGSGDTQALEDAIEALRESVYGRAPTGAPK